MIVERASTPETNFPMVGIYIRFYIFIVIIGQSDYRDRIVYKTYIDLDSCVEIDLVNFVFAKSYNL